MKRRSLFFLILVLMTVCLDLYLLETCRQAGRTNRLLDSEEALTNLRAMRVPEELLGEFWELDAEEMGWQEYLCMYLISGETDPGRLLRDREIFHKLKRAEYDAYLGYVQALWEDLKFYPVPLAAGREDLTVSYVDSWMTERTYGGVRGHEGCDMMASFNQRGHYPVLSMTDGVVEQIGWLPKGGYRIGIRSPHGGYFYYAHLYDYAREFAPGDTVKAGEWIGFMGDSGYSEVEGTVGNFDVHLHVGVYVNQADGSELSLNPYALLRALEGQKITCYYE